MDDIVKTMIAQALMVPALVQMVVYVLTPNCSYIEAWKRAGQLFAILFALRTGPDRKFVVALILTAYIVGLPLTLAYWSS